MVRIVFMLMALGLGGCESEPERVAISPLIRGPELVGAKQPAAYKLLGKPAGVAMESRGVMNDRTAVWWLYPEYHVLFVDNKVVAFRAPLTNESLLQAPETALSILGFINDDEKTTFVMDRTTGRLSASQKQLDPVPRCDWSFLIRHDEVKSLWIEVYCMASQG